jgi:16S rRNA (adenine(1408)-N(1))-methyltransferase
LGTGDGAAVLRLARREPETLVIGVDTNASAMRAPSDRASRKPSRGGTPNALFLAGTLDELATLPPLAGVVTEVRVILPWGSLLQNAACAEASFVADLRRLMTRDGQLQLLLSVATRDATTGLPPLTDESVKRLADTYAEAGILIARARRATESDVDDLGSSWARRLGIPRQREAWLLLGGPVATR